MKGVFPIFQFIFISRQMNIRTKRIYEPFGDEDQIRILVDRLWPRGISKGNARIDHWFKDVAPSNELRQWYQHDHSKWEEFQKTLRVGASGQWLSNL